MAKDSIIIIGSGGIGKGPLSKLFKVDHTWNPYRMRITGPRKDDGTKYVSPTVYLQFQLILKRLGYDPIVVGYLNEAPSIDNIPGHEVLSSEEKEWFDKNRTGILWYGESKILFYPVRTEQFQMLVLDGHGVVQAELYALVLEKLLNSDVKAEFGNVSALILNPMSEKIDDSLVVKMQEKTKINCELRLDESKNKDKRVNTIPTELPIWNALAGLSNVYDCTNWIWPEGRYIQPHFAPHILGIKDDDQTSIEKANIKPPFDEGTILEHQKELFKQIRKYLLKNNYVTEDVLKTCKEIDEISELIVEIPDSLKKSP